MMRYSICFRLCLREREGYGGEGPSVLNLGLIRRKMIGGISHILLHLSMLAK
jgi:hypothetical protein